MASARADVMLSYRVPETGKPTDANKAADNTAPDLARILRAAGYTVFLDVDEMQVTALP